MVFLLALLSLSQAAAPIPGFRPPSTPLVVFDPYISIWSFTDKLTDSWPSHWSGPVMALSGMLRIDGAAYRFMGPGGGGGVCDNAMSQTSVTVYPTQTVYVFDAAGVRLTLTFTTPSMLSSSTVLSFNDPVTYVTYSIVATDGKTHAVQIYWDNTGEVAVNSVSTYIQWSRISSISGQTVMRIGASTQNYLSEQSDQLNWGFWYLSVPSGADVATTMAGSASTRQAFVNGQTLPPDDNRQPRQVQDDWPVLAVTWNLGNVGTTAVSRYLTIVYDDVYSMKYFGDSFTPYWVQPYGNVNNLISSYASKYTSTVQSATSYDTTLLNSLSAKGGDQYATICSLAYRQVTGGVKLTWNDRTKAPWLFLKEISSDGDVSTVDVVFPASPFFMYLAPEALRMMLLPLLAYSNNETAQYGLNTPYNLAWAPHHLGTWPICDLPANQQEQMPMEETGNMLIMMAAIAQAQQKNVTYLNNYWPLLNTWAQYLNISLPDPEDQLCTDDFEGPSPHNVNLAAKGIVGIGAYALLMQMKGDAQTANSYMNWGANFVNYWMTNANDGNHYRLQYNLPNTWSTKYNLMYQPILGLTLFPQSVFTTELNYYVSSHLNKFGVPLDDRATFAKGDWLMWTAPLGTSSQFQQLVTALYNFANTTPDHVPFTDWYDTIAGTCQGFRARPVMGGLYTRMLFP